MAAARSGKLRGQSAAGPRPLSGAPGPPFRLIRTAPRLRRSFLGVLVALLLAAAAVVGQERVLAELERRLAANPRDAAALEELGLEHLRRGDHALAFIQFHKSLAVAPERAAPWFYLGLVYYEKGLYFKEIQAYEKALLRLPEFLPARLNLAHAYLSVGRIEDAVEQYRSVERRDPRNSTVLYNLGIIFADLDRPAEARTYLEAYLRLAPEADPARARAAEILAEIHPER